MMAALAHLDMGIGTARQGDNGKILIRYILSFISIVVTNARPMLIEQLLSVDVVGVGAGAEHVVVVGGQGDVYAWGRGQGGARWW